MTDRISCCVPFCRRTTRSDWSTEWICGKHWPLVSRHLRRRDSKLVRRYVRKFGHNHFSRYPGGSAQRIEAVRLTKIIEKSWDLCRKQAIERAAGI